MSADDEELAKLMREIDAMTQDTPAAAPPPAGPPATTSSSEVATTDGQRSPRVKWALMATGGGAVAGFLIGSILGFLPFVDGISTALGAALGSAIVAFVSGPPSWLK